MLIGVLGVACDDDDETTAPTIADLVGTWQMTSGSLGSIDLSFAVNDVTLEIDDTGAFTLTITPLAGPATVITGDFEITGNTSANIITDDDPDNPIPATFNLSGNTLRVQAADVELLDITGDGMITSADEADLDITFQRQ
jgi:hypothetical protein